MSLGLLGSAANKGSTGLSIRYYDTSLALIAAHFSADAKGSSRISKRHSVRVGAGVRAAVGLRG